MEVWILDVKMKTVSPGVFGEIKTERRDEMKKRKKIHIPARISADGRVAVSIYGVVRAAVETIFRKTPKEELKKIFGIDGALLNVCDTGGYGALGCGKCIACEMFGSIGNSARMGNVRFSDLYSTKPASEIVDVVFHSKVDRESGVVTQSTAIEEIKEGAEFEGKIIIRNPKDVYVKILEAAFKYIEEVSGIGGWKRRGRGFVKFETKLRKTNLAEILTAVRV